MAKYIAVFVLVVLTAYVGSSEGKHFTRCELVHELRRQGFPEKDLRNWVCLIESESSRYTDKVNVNKNGSRDYGLFQINDAFWCSRSGAPGKDCHVTCADVKTNDITKASVCAKKIFKRQGFKAWYGWKRKCQGKLPDIKSC